jgi:hypothetical protein
MTTIRRYRKQSQREVGKPCGAGMGCMGQASLTSMRPCHARCAGPAWRAQDSGCRTVWLASMTWDGVCAAWYGTVRHSSDVGALHGGSVAKTRAPGGRHAGLLSQLRLLAAQRTLHTKRVCPACCGARWITRWRCVRPTRTCSVRCARGLSCPPKVGVWWDGLRPAVAGQRWRVTSTCTCPHLCCPGPCGGQGAHRALWQAGAAPA